MFSFSNSYFALWLGNWFEQSMVGYKLELIFHEIAFSCVDPDEGMNWKQFKPDNL